MTRAERRREVRAKKAAEARLNPSPYGMNRKMRRLFKRQLDQTVTSKQGILVPK